MYGSYWQHDANWKDQWRTTALPSQVDFVVVGAGLSGLTTAIELRNRHPSARIAVIEAERVGYGASGRSAGFLSPVAVPLWVLGAQRDASQAWAASRINAEVHTRATWLLATIHGCEIQKATLSMQSRSALGDLALSEFAHLLSAAGLHHLVSHRADVGHSIEMDAYTMHPYKLIQGLAQYASAQGIYIRERSRVRKFQPIAAGLRIHLDGSEILHATNVVVCTNAYTDSLDVGERVRAIALHTFMTATAPLEDREFNAAKGTSDFVVEVNRAQVYHRSHNNRILYGGLDKWRTPTGGDFVVPQRYLRELRQYAQKTFPMLPSLDVEHAWSGRFHATATGLPIIRRSSSIPNLTLNVGYGGTGVALALVFGKLAAAISDNGVFADSNDARLWTIMQHTVIAPRDVLNSAARLLRSAAQPWLHRIE
jgi:glycine/D-amino acid oxidase-like deaminating enzyme